MSTFGVRNQCIFIALYSAVILFCACAMSESGSLTTVTRYVCCSCESRQISSFYCSRANVHRHMAKSARCKASTVKKVNIIARAGDVIAGGAGGMGPCPLPQHQPPGKCHSLYIYEIYLIIMEIYHTYIRYNLNK